MKRRANIFLATALLVTLAVPWQPARAAQYTDATAGYTFSYPDDWTVEPYSDANGSVVTVRNFRAYLHGGSPPMGGAYIAMHSYPPYPSWWPPDTDEYQWLEKWGQTFNVIVHPSRSIPGPARLVFTSESTAGPVDTHVSIALRKGGRLFRIGLEYQTADLNGPLYEQVLSGIIDSLAPGTQLTATPAA